MASKDKQPRPSGNNVLNSQGSLKGSFVQRQQSVTGLLHVADSTY